MKTLNDNPSSGNPVPTDKEFYERGFDKTVEAELFDNGPESPDERIENGAVKGVAWLGAIIGVFALAILIAALFNVNPSPSAQKSQPARTAMQSAFISAPGAQAGASAAKGKYAANVAKSSAQPVVLQTITVIGQETGNAINNAASKASAAVSNVAAKASSVKDQAASAASMSKADMDRIEKEALEVIHGDYGNNPGRAAKLGADYALVQARVNQLMHI